MSYYEDARDAFRRGATGVVEQLSLEEVARARASADVAAEVEALCMLARVAVRGGDIPEAQRLGAEARSLASASGERGLERTPLHILAGSARITGDLAAARTLYGESIALNESLGESRMVVVEQHNLAYIELHAGDLDKARTLFRGACRQTVEGGYEDMFLYAALDTAVMSAADGDFPRAARYLAAVDSTLLTLGQILDPDDAIEQETLRDRLLQELGRGTFDAAYQAGVGADIRRLLTE